MAEWIGNIFYDILPKHGYEIREEQIYTAYQMADAFCKRQVHFAEAGLGVGKTFAYLVSAVAYARLKGKPVIIACASSALQEQLAGPQGDINTLSHLLDLDIDARMAKESSQYLCDLKVRRFTQPFGAQTSSALGKAIRWAEETKRGERSEIPHISDHIWTQLAWDEAMPCDGCSSRGFCKLAKARDFYRPAKDLIVCDHGVFFDDLWSRAERKMEGKLPLLPDYAAVIFDEGHKVLLPAAKRAGRYIVRGEIDGMTSLIEQLQGARTSLLASAVAVSLASAKFFKVLRKSVIKEERNNRQVIQVNDELFAIAETLKRAFDSLDVELQNEQELHSQTLPANRLLTYELRVEHSLEALNSFCNNRGRDALFWLDRLDDSFWVIPRQLNALLREHLFSKEIPVLFSSATLSIGGDFNYLATSLGVTEPSGSSVEGSFDYEKQTVVYLMERFQSEDQIPWRPRAVQHLVSLLERSQGRALVLTNSFSETKKLRAHLKQYQFPFKILWEDKAERGYLLGRFREDVSSVLVGSEFWEGIDIPGEALSLLIIWQLPFPPKDPLIEAQRSEVKERGLDPVTEVDYPEMGLRLKQGCGRLIRRKEDHGIIAILEPVFGMPWQEVVLKGLPKGAKVLTLDV
ncbi:ATP-dependent DNA helicase [Metallumcola ferriviriculae]|uniref:ATP-dependent DNA helicase n=1 Tax=Metallumcola ferriviriculae TaxID=3039180 RepID=A0AAU0UNL1_9FIRM|nr:ATP-dependent DNA helicase [Desulfitibacteraceae bacterium MK1]